MAIWYPSSSISMDRKDYYNEKFILHVYWNSNEIIAILGNFLKYKMRHILLEYFNSVSANLLFLKSAKLLNIYLPIWSTAKFIALLIIGINWNSAGRLVFFCFLFLALRSEPWEYPFLDDPGETELWSKVLAKLL